MPSFTTSPETPRKDAAERYSPETAAEFSNGETLREATRKSDVVRMAATPRRPTRRVMRTTGATARMAITGGHLPVGQEVARETGTRTAVDVPTRLGLMP